MDRRRLVAQAHIKRLLYVQDCRLVPGPLGWLRRKRLGCAEEGVGRPGGRDTHRPPTAGSGSGTEG